MKKHRTQEHNELSERLCDEFNEAKSLRELAYVSHIFIEYYINELLVAKFKAPELVIDDKDLATFKNKILLLRAMGAFDGQPHVLRNIELIQRIRNFYAHNLLMSDEVPDSVANQVKELAYLDLEGNVAKYDVPWDEHEEPVSAQLHVCAVETTNVLIRIQELLIE